LVAANLDLSVPGWVASRKLPAQRFLERFAMRFSQAGIFALSVGWSSRD
jgi:hypothetical protein